ncbi:hypothetical protein CRG98_043329 [Punica granatum]|uniref:Uncharacterized protein n=1 Tax=Punica granatum TaxID=22663 RepID=A0A2I0HXF3_PUNGR|nr:hypothetical protein CRG98_043329 [Punica granatum]
MEIEGKDWPRGLPTPPLEVANDLRQGSWPSTTKPPTQIEILEASPLESQLRGWGLSSVTTIACTMSAIA